MVTNFPQGPTPQGLSSEGQAPPGQTPDGQFGSGLRRSFNLRVRTMGVSALFHSLLFVTVGFWATKSYREVNTPGSLTVDLLNVGEHPDLHPNHELQSKQVFAKETQKAHGHALKDEERHREIVAPQNDSQAPAVAHEHEEEAAKDSGVPASAGSGEGQDKLTVETQYVSEIVNRFERNKVYPKEAVDREEEGRVVLALTIDGDGSVSNARITEPSPFRLLNDAAMLTVRKVGRLPPTPPVLPHPLHVHVPMKFQIDRR